MTNEGSLTVRERVWDLPLRLFHWALVTLVIFSLYTGIKGGFREMDYHMISGYAILTLVIFRILWGFIGSKHSKFKSFITLRKLVPYTRQILNSESQTFQGHNPLGG